MSELSETSNTVNIDVSKGKTNVLVRNLSMEDSLVKRLAGPSTGKAGLAKDQTDINRIIAEASKGSKFYGNEKRKDQELTVKIENLLKHKDKMMRDVDIGTQSAQHVKVLS
jgi:hypothetical protein